MAKINFETKLFKIGADTILLLPASASSKLPSRGICVVKGTINNSPLEAVLEPDGKGSHWLKMDKTLKKTTGAKADDTVKLSIEATKDWPEPIVPKDLKDALQSSSTAYEVWLDITPMARWDWIRWINATKNPDTRKKRIDVALSKMNAGSRRPCCFNRNECTDMSVSDKGVLRSI